ncbi:MarR family transcriptional regulator [Amycolatopsis sp. K13G38]|uniref:MarR family transcriptional regulator n=1 Tax=Amycolatopsis acididurans TaxID=2724524 RepID=A0ABX1J4F9_9PSEU|nr:MarR family transcriptional regulator [Amycolatopsis acididurans]NKQ54653.1 MarR family transcriptional regulator [Amycolatopsis acididurans]
MTSPGAPGAETLLLRSGRVSEAEWMSATHDRPGLIAAGNVGSSELEVVSTVVAQDAAFAIAAGSVEECVVDKATDGPALPLARGADPDWLIRETARRLTALAALPHPVSPYRERFLPAPDVDPDSLAANRREILANANGRRSARDIAFVVCRGIYPVTIEISRMLQEGLMRIAVNIAPNPPAAPVTAKQQSGKLNHEGQLPRRKPGGSGVAEVLPRLLNLMRKESHEP